MPEDSPKLEAWIRFGQPLDSVIDDYPRILDAWEVIGVRGIVVGRMLVRDDAGRNQAIFQPDPRIYRRLGVEPPPSPTQLFPGKRRKLDRLFADAKRRGWKILVFRPDAGYGPSDQDKFARFANPNRWAARALDTLAQFPEADGGIRRPPVAFGQDNEYVYKELLGVTDEEFARLIDEGHIATKFSETL